MDNTAKDDQEKNCYLGINGKKYGPVSEQDVRYLFERNKINGDTKFARKGTSEWITVAESGVIAPLSAAAEDDGLPPLPPTDAAAYDAVPAAAVPNAAPAVAVPNAVPSVAVPNVAPPNAPSAAVKKKGRWRAPAFIAIPLLIIGLGWAALDAYNGYKKADDWFAGKNASVSEESGSASTKRASKESAAAKKENNSNNKAESGFSESDLISFVKEGSLQQYPNIRVGDAMGAFIAGLKWEGGVDGGRYYVNAAGKITLYGELTDVIVQYELFPEEGVFQYNAIALGGEEAGEYFYRDFEYNMADAFLYGADTLENNLIRAVKSGQLYAYEGVALGFALESFIATPEWEGGLMTDGSYAVIVRGEIEYAGRRASIAVQYDVDTDTGDFEYYAMEIDGEPQSTDIYFELIDKAMEEYGEFIR